MHCTHTKPVRAVDGGPYSSLVPVEPIPMISGTPAVLRLSTNYCLSHLDRLQDVTSCLTHTGQPSGGTRYIRLSKTHTHTLTVTDMNG